MATKLTLSTQSALFTQLGIDAGALKNQCNIFHQSLELDDTKDELLIQLSNIMKGIMEQRKTADELWKSIDSSNKIASEIFKTQYRQIEKTIDASTESAIESGHVVLDTQLQKVKDLFELAKHALNRYRNDPLANNLQSAVNVIDKFEKTATYIARFEKRCNNMSLVEDFESNSREYTSAAHRMQTLIAYQLDGEFGHLCTHLKYVCQQEVVEAKVKEELLTEFDRYLNEEFSEETCNLIDHKTFEIAPEPKEGEDWGKLHRYDDIHRFKKAFFGTISERLENHLKYMNQKDLSEFYKTLHSFSCGPQDVDPKTWVQSELPSILCLASNAIETITKQREQGDLYIDEEESSEEATSGSSLDQTEESRSEEENNPIDMLTAEHYTNVT